MKMKLILSVVFIFLFSMIGPGCDVEEGVYELYIWDENPVIQKEINGVEFSFCLLNEQGKPATVFKEGENFCFQFLIKNKTLESLPFYDFGYYTTYDFLSVRSETENYGRPMNFISYSSTKELKWILPEDTLGFNVPWHEERTEFPMAYGIFEGSKQPYLAKGKYFTKFIYNFRFGMPDKKPEIETGKLTFIINFEIN